MMKSFLRIALPGILGFLLGIVLFFALSFRLSLPRSGGAITFGGLASDVEIIRDRWGVPHIFARNENDLFFAAGFVHAQDRMWQMEMWRRAGSGRLSEVFGQATLEQDKLVRVLGLKEAAWEDFKNLTPGMKEILRSYAGGVNAWMKSRKFDWPPEFILLRFRPEPWTVMDSLFIKGTLALILSADYESEVMRGKLAGKLGPEKALEILEEGSPMPVFLPDEKALLHLLAPNFVFQGSNNWVAGGSLTKSGKPLLANDPHLEISVPPIWFEMHLQCPSLHAAGVTFPGVPLVIIGHNGTIAWGLTNSAADTQDVFIEKLDSGLEMYLDGEEWKLIEKRNEVVFIRGKKEPEVLEILWTERGPVITPHLQESSVPLSLSWTIYRGGRTFEAFYLLNKAGNWEEFKEALDLYDAPSQNFVYADVQGNIGYRLAGKIPLRPEETALYPYPGWKEEGKWRGFLASEERPALFNPAEGLIVTANNWVVSDDFPYYISRDWDIPFRAERIKELLLKTEKHSVESFKSIQNDIYSKKAELFMPHILETGEADGKGGEALEILKNWDMRMSSGKEAALYSVFMNFFHEDVFRDELGEDFQRFNSLFRRKRAGLLRIISDPLSPWFDRADTHQRETRADIIRLSLARAFEWLESEYGPSEKWDWVEMHSLTFRHDLGHVPFFRFLNRGTYPMEGDAFTVNSSHSEGFGTTHGASYRQIIDLSDLRNSVCVITSGQSGHFLSRFYDNQIPLWLEGKYHPMLFYPEDIRAQAWKILRLKAPARKE